MKRVLSIISAGVLAFMAASCVNEELTVFDPSNATAPVLNSYEVGETAITATYTPGAFKQGFNEKIAPNHALALVSLDGSPVSKTLTTSDKEGVLTLSVANLAKALISLGRPEGSLVNIELAVRATMQDPSKDNGLNGSVDSQGRITLSGYEVYIPTGNPYDRYTEDSPWGLVGSFNGWGEGGDYPMYSNGTLHVAKEVQLSKNDEVKFRKDKNWDINFGYAEGVDSYTLDEEFAVAAGGPNIIIAEDGVYYVVLDPDGKKAKIVAASTGDDSLPSIDFNDYEFNDAMAGAETWGIIGPAVLDWNTDIDMEKVSDNPETWVAKNIPFQEDKFKFRGNDTWGDYDLGGAPEFKLDTPLQLSKGGGDMAPTAPGIYNVYLYPTYMLVYFTEGEGDAPLPPAKPKAWSLIGTIGGSTWNQDFDLENVSGDKWLIKNVTIKEGEEFKIRADHDWAKSYGGPEENDTSTAEEGNPYGVYKPEIGTEFAAGDKNIRIPADGAYNVTFNYGEEPTILIEEYKEFPDELYMVGQDFGGWDWSSDGVVKLIPVVHNPSWSAEAEGQFWTVRYFKAGNGFKFNSHRDWDGGQFGHLETNDGFTNDNDDNVQVPEDGHYLVHIDMKRNILHVEPARVYGIGKCFGDLWDEEMEDALFKPDGTNLSLTLPDGGEFRMYVASSIATSAWWTREFIFFDGLIDYRGDDEGQGDQGRVNLLKGQTVSLDFNAGTATVYGEGEAPTRPTAWSLVGTISDSSWGTDFDLTNTSGDTWVIRQVTIRTNDEFKIRADHDWATSVGGPEENDQSTWEEGNVYGVYKPVIGEAFTAGDKNIRIGEDGVFDITYDYKANTILIERHAEFPEHLYMIGEDFGGWDWNSDGVVELTPVLHKPDWTSEAPGQFWTVRYIKAGKGFKFSPVRAWAGSDFWGMTTNDGYTESGGNCVVAEDGFYMIHIDFKREMVHVEKAQIYGIGEAFGGWDGKMADALFTEKDGKLVATTKAAANLRIYAESSISTSPWWSREFVPIDGKITYRILEELPGVVVEAGKTVTLDFNAGTGTIE